MLMMHDVNPLAQPPVPEPVTTVQMARAELLAPDLHRSLFSEILDWPGTLDQNLVRRHGGNAAPVKSALLELFDAGLVQFVPTMRTSRNLFIGNLVKPPGGQTILNHDVRMYYGADDAGTFLNHQDGVSVNSIRSRQDAALKQDHRLKRPHRNHTGQLDDVVTFLKLNQYTVRSGRRDLVVRPGLPQLKPDAVLTATMSLPSMKVASIDAASEDGIRVAVRNVLTPYLAVGYGGIGAVVALSCQDEPRAVIAEDEAHRLLLEHDLPVMVETLVVPYRSRMSAVEQLVSEWPDLFINVNLPLEYERSKTTPGGVRRKLGPYAEHARAGHDIAVGVVTETARVQQFVLEESEALMQLYGVRFLVITSTYDKITRGLAAGDPEVWSRWGYPVVLL